jgi:hypothetical protein
VTAEHRLVVAVRVRVAHHLYVITYKCIGGRTLTRPAAALGGPLAAVPQSPESYLNEMPRRTR